MGLDMVELVLVIEDEFDIYMADEEWENLSTPDDIAAHIYDRYQKSDSDKCSSQVAFYQLRNLLLKNFDLEQKDIQPHSMTEDILKGDMRKNWHKLNELLGNKLYPRYLELQELVWWKHIVIIIPITAMLLWLSGNLIFSIPIALILYSILRGLISVYFGIIIPQRYQKLSSLLKYLDDCGTLSPYKTKEKILKRVIELSSEELCIPIDKIRRDSKYVDDLGVE